VPPHDDTDAQQPSGDATPTWYEFTREVHNMDKRLVLVEAAQIHQATRTDSIVRELKELSSGLQRIQNQLAGWKGSVAVLVALISAAVQVAFFVAGRLWQ
jgi:hypothetical protein